MRDKFDDDISLLQNITRNRYYITMPIRRTKVQRNAPCPCGSGKKYKTCCMNKPHWMVRVWRRIFG
jgi:uncharacterized protein YchJ